MMRLDKFLCACQVGSRTEVKKQIRLKQVTVNGKTALSPEEKIDETKDQVACRGKLLVYEPYVYYLLYKPAGCVTAVRDKIHPTVMEYLPKERPAEVVPVGRLDLDTEGLLLLTNDGTFAHHIISPSHHLKKTYEALLDAPVPPEAKEAFAKGIDIGDDAPTLPAELEIFHVKADERIASLPDSNGFGGTRPGGRAQLSITEGRYHQVKRMFAAVGCKVLYLKRLSIGNLTLEGLKPGECRRLTAEEIALLSRKFT